MLSQTRKFHILFGAGLFLIIGLGVAGVVDVLQKKKEAEVRRNAEDVKPFLERREKALALIREEPGRVIPYVELAVAEKALGNIDAAITALVRAGQIAPKNYLVFGNLANLYVEKGMVKEADIAYARALSTGPKEIENYVQYAEFLSYRFPERKNDILALYGKGLKELNGNANVYRARAGYYTRVGEYANALSDWREVLKKEPDNAAVKEEIQSLEVRLRNH